MTTQQPLRRISMRSRKQEIFEEYNRLKSRLVELTTKANNEIRKLRSELETTKTELKDHKERIERCTAKVEETTRKWKNHQKALATIGRDKDRFVDNLCIATIFFRSKVDVFFVHRENQVLQYKNRKWLFHWIADDEVLVECFENPLVIRMSWIARYIVDREQVNISWQPSDSAALLRFLDSKCEVVPSNLCEQILHWVSRQLS